MAPTETRPQRRAAATADSRAGVRALLQAAADAYEGPGECVGDSGEDECDTECREQHQREQTWFARTTHPPPTAAADATAANVTAIPISVGSPLVRKGRLA